jgi:dipeptidyl aminopeptidase/acylaminoacyl peptidase
MSLLQIALCLLPLRVAHAGSIEVASIEGANIQRPVWAPDGSQLSWEANFHELQSIDLYIGDPFTRRFQKLGGAAGALGPTLSGFQSTAKRGRVAQDISFSPVSEARMVYTASSSSLDLELHIEGSGTVAAHPGADGGAEWSPNGRHIAFTSSRSGEGDLYLIDVRDPLAKPRRITAHEQTAELYVDWSHDSRNVVYVAHGRGGDNLWILTIEGGTPRRLTTWPGSQLRPRFAPDDSLVAFYANRERPDRFDLYVVGTASGSTPTKLAEDVIPNSTGPQWSPDGRHVIFTARDDDAYNPICLVPVDYPAGRQTLPLDTVGHGDLSVVGGLPGEIRLAYVAQGRADEDSLSFKRLYVTELRLP